jgi:hypothetical protein
VSALGPIPKARSTMHIEPLEDVTVLAMLRRAAMQALSTRNSSSRSLLGGMANYSAPTLTGLVAMVVFTTHEPV